MESGGRVCCALKGVLEVWYGAMRGYDVLYCVLCVVCVWGGGGGDKDWKGYLLVRDQRGC